MGGYMGTVRRRIAAGAVGAALLGVGVGFGAHAASSGATVTRPASDQAAVTTSPAPTTAAATSSAAQATQPAPTTVTVVEQPPAVTQAATVDQVDTTPAPPPDSTPTEQPSGDPAPDAPAGSTVAPDGLTYAPMPSPTMEKLPGEPGYVPSGSASQSPTG